MKFSSTRLVRTGVDEYERLLGDLGGAGDELAAAIEKD